ncbi:ankyrin repeat-containing domain protein [Trichoderma ceciliae]
MDLFSAAMSGDENLVQKLLNDENVNFRDKNCRTPLYHAAEHGRKNIVEFLLAQDKINVNEGGPDGFTPLSVAALNGNRDVVELIISRNDVDLNPTDTSGSTPLSWAISRGDIGVAELLISKRGVNVNVEDNYGQTLLSKAAEVRCMDIVRMLILRDDIDLNLKRDDDWISFLRAISDGHMDVMKLLVSKCNIDLRSRNKQGRTLLSSMAVKEENFDIIELLLTKQCAACPGRTPLSWAAEIGDFETTHLLLVKSSIDPNAGDSNGRTPLSRAAENGHASVISLLLAEDITNPNIKDSEGRTPLSWAAGNGHHGAVTSLLTKNKTNLNIKDRDGRTPLSWAAGNGYWTMVQLLLAKETTDPNIRDNNGQTPLWWAIENGHQKVVNLLAPTDTVTMSLMVQQGKQMAIKLLCDAGSNINERNDHGQTPLHIAVSLRRPDIARDLLSRGAKTDLRDSGDMTPLRMVVRAKDDQCIRELLRCNASMEDIMVDEWRDAYDKGREHVVLISESVDEKYVDFATTFPIASELSRASTALNNTCSLYSFVENLDRPLWPKVPIVGSEERLVPNQLHVRIPKKDGDDLLDVSVSLLISFGHYVFPTTSSALDTSIYRIAWKIKRPTNPSSSWVPVVYFSTLPNGWMPANELDLFKQLISLVKEKWMALCEQFEKYLSSRRLHQLKDKGNNPEMIDLLANDSRKLAELRGILQDQIRVAKKFVNDYCRQYSVNQDKKGLLGLLTDEFELVVNNMLGQLDQTVRDFLQIEFAWTSINETRISTRLGQNVMLFTYVSIFYLPLGFCAALWAIPDITDSGTRTPFIITCITVGLITLLVTFNMGRIAEMMRRVLQYGKGVLEAHKPGENW